MAVLNGHTNGHSATANGETNDHVNGNATNGRRTSQDDTYPEPIAIIGAACRLPGEASSMRGLWDMMQNSRTAHAKVPKERWDADAWYHPDPDRKGSLNTTHGFFLQQDVGAFDAPFFSVTAKEAAGMDPAKRILLEVAYEAFENAGLPMDDIAGSMTGVYVGSMTSDYELLSTREIYDEPHMAAAGSSEAMTANRVSWFFDLRGPSLTLDTACSSSLYALHLACQSLRLKETNMALVAGVNVILHPNFMQQLVAMHMLSPDGISHTFDDRANGYGRGEGFGGLIVKRLSDALRDGDTIRAVIRGSGVNVDGKTPSVTMPSSEAQASLIRTVYEEAGLPLDKTPYIELHGTGTPVGDPIELSAIAATFGASSPPNHPVYVGSIKPNVGHTEGCAGLAGVFKAIMCLEKGIILPTAEVETINPKLRFEDWNLALPKNPITWPSQGPRRISVNSFGFGGANAHVILDDAYHFLQDRGLTGKHSTVTKPILLQLQSPGSDVLANGNEHSSGNGHTNGNGHGGDSLADQPQQKLFVLSSRDEAGIQRLAKSLESYWKSAKVGGNVVDSPKYASDVAYTLASRRSLFDYRSFAVADSTTALAQQFEKSLPRLKRSAKQNGVAFVFTGQGAQWAGMGRQLMSFPVFAASIAKSKAYLDSLNCVFDLEAEMFNIKNSKIETSEYSQPICTAVQVALVDLLADWLVKPKSVVGHSSGEMAAAYAAGILTHEDAVKVAFLRGVYSQKVTDGPKAGGMLAAGISPEEAQQYLDDVPSGSVVIACINSPKSVTLSGDVEIIDQLEASISKDAKFARKLRVVTAYHSPHMKLVADDCLDAMISRNIGNPQTTATAPMFSSVTGQLIDPAEVVPGYWIRNMCGTVRFSEAVHSLLTHSPGKRASRKKAVLLNALIEVGPHAALKAPLVQIMEGVDSKLPSELAYSSILQRGEDAVTSSLKAAGQLWALGISISLDKVNQEAAASVTPQAVADLPSYPWNHDKQYWHETAATKEQRLQQKSRSDLLGIAVENQNPFEPQWKNYLRVRENPWVEDHKITGTTLYPGAGMLVMVLEAVKEIVSQNDIVKGVEFKNVHFDRGLVIPDEGATETLLRIQGAQGEASTDRTFAVFSRIGGNPWTKHCYGAFTIIFEDFGVLDSEDLAAFEWKTYLDSYEAVKKLPSQEADVRKLYKSLHAVGMQYGPTFQNLTSLVASPENSSCYGTVSIPDTKSVMPHEFEYPHLIHPATLDAIFHLIVVAVANGTTLTEAAVPYMLESLFISFDLPQGPGAVFSGFSQRVERRDKQLAADLIVSDESWDEPKIIVKGLIMRQVTSGASDAETSTDDKKKTTKIVWKADPSSLSNVGSNDVSSPIQISRLQEWLELEAHKSSNLKVLIVGNTVKKDTAAEIEPFIRGTSSYHGFARCTIIDTSEESLEEWKTQTNNSIIPVAFGIWDGISNSDDSLFDIIIVGQEHEAVAGDSASIWSQWAKQINSNGRLLVLQDDESRQVGANGINTTHEVGPVRTTISLQGGASLGIYSQQVGNAIHPDEVYLILPSKQDVSSNVLYGSIQEAFISKGISTHITYLENVAQLKGQHVISLLTNSFVSSWTSEEFQLFQTLVGSAAHIFWITSGAQMLQPSEAGLEGAPVPGLLRVLRNEFPQTTLAQLDLSPTFDVLKPDSANLVLNAWLSSVDDHSEQVKDLELAELNGVIFLPRVVAEPNMDRQIALTTGSSAPSPKALSLAGPLRLVSSSEAGGNIVWESDESTNLHLGPDQVEIKVIDISADMNYSKAHELFGTQITGHVSRCGSNVSEFLQGDRVVAFGASDCRTHVRQDRSLVLRVPESVSTEGSAAIIWALLTANYILKHVTRISDGQNILIQDVATSLGQALLHIARQTTGVKVFVTVKTPEQKAALVKRLHVSKENVLILEHQHDGTRLATYLRSKTGGEGIDIAVCSTSDIDITSDLAPSLADFASIAVVLGTSQSATAPSSVLQGNVNFSIIDPVRILQEKPKLLAKLLREIPQLIRNGDGLPGIEPKARFSIADLSETLAWMQQGPQTGILSLQLQSPDEEILVPVAQPPPAPLRLDPSATYILAGGLGSLGLRIADVMALNGATHLVFLSRSGGGRYADRLSQLNQSGCSTMVVKCDVTSLDDVRNVVAEVAQTGRSIKGLIQCAMVLQDSLFEKMTFAQWNTAFNPKVSGSWNLHETLPKDLDFFIMLSSVVSVIGNVSQANYAAGNSYMDALAHYRRSLGLSAVSINAGLVADSDHTIDGTSMEEYLERFKHMASVSTTLEELDIAIIASMKGATANDGFLEPQFVFCMTDSLQPDGVDQWARDRKFSHRIAISGGNDSAGASELSGPSISEILGAATSKQDAQLAIQEAMKRLLAPGLGIQPADIDDDRPLYDVGVDSFRAVEIRNHVFRELKSDISVFEILSPNSLAQLSGIITARSQLVPVKVREMEE